MFTLQLIIDIVNFLLPHLSIYNFRHTFENGLCNYT